MGASCTHDYVDISPQFNIKDGKITEAVRKMKQAPNQQFLMTLQRFIQIQIAKNDTKRIKNLLNVSNRIINDINGNKNQRNLAKNLDEAFLSPMKDLEVILKTICQQFKALQIQKDHNDKFLQKFEKPWWDSLNKLMQKTKIELSIKPHKDIELTQSRDSRQDSEQLSHAAGEDRRFSESSKFDEKIQQSIQKIKQIFNYKQQIDYEQMKDTTNCRLESIRLNVNKMMQQNKNLAIQLSKAEHLRRQLDLDIENVNHKNQTLTSKLSQAEQKLLADMNKILSLQKDNEMLKNSLSNHQYKMLKIDSDKHEPSSTLDGVDEYAKEARQQKNSKIWGFNKEQAKLNQFRATSIFMNFGCSEVLVSSENRISYNYRYCIDQMFEEEGKKIVSTKKIFQYDPIRPNNMYYYLKDHENLIVLLKMKNGVILGGYSQQSFKYPKDNNNAFIFSITKSDNPKSCQKLTLKDNQLAKFSVKIDQDFLKFGSNEIRIRCQSLQGFANISGSTAIYHDPTGAPLSVQAFLNQKQYRFAIENYEIYTLTLKPIDDPKKTLRKNSHSSSYISSLE